MIYKVLFVIGNIALLLVPPLMFYYWKLKKIDCRFKTLLNLAIRSTLILVATIILVVISKVTWWAVVAFLLFHLLNILLFKGQRKTDVYLR